MRSNSRISIMAILTLLGTSPAAVAAVPSIEETRTASPTLEATAVERGKIVLERENQTALQALEGLDAERGKIVRKGSRHVVAIDMPEPGKYVDRAGRLLVSLELPKTIRKDKTQLSVSPFASAQNRSLVAKNTISAKRIEIVPQESQSTFPPGSDDATHWVTISVPTKSLNSLTPIFHVEFEFTSEKPIEFTRVLLGSPQTLNSRIVGVFGASRKKMRGLPVIKAGMDYLGTKEAVIRFIIPANTLGVGTEAFDEMIEFKETPLQPDVSTTDTLLVRLRDVHPGETTPFRILAFSNTSLKPIKIKSPQGDMYFSISASKSPNAESDGFISIYADGTYKSAAVLFPLLKFQRVEGGKPVGDPIIIDTARTPIPGFPLYLASNGGKWQRTAPKGRFAPATTSNYFYVNHENSFLSSSGPSFDTLGKCAKTAAELAGVQIR